MKLANSPRSILSVIRDSRGANMVEYIILVGVIALLALVAFKTFGGSVSSKITEQASAVNGISTPK